MGNQSLLLSAIASGVKQKAQQTGLLPPDTQFSHSNLDKADEDAIRECVWGLIIQGIVAPGTCNDDTYPSNLPWGK
jgi:hypothetical protein